MLRHLEDLCSHHGARSGVLHMRKFLSSYVKGLSQAARFRMVACVIDSPQRLKQAIRDFFASQSDQVP